MIEEVVDSIAWKANKVKVGEQDTKWWNKGYFTRTQNNIKVNLYYFSEEIKRYPYAKKKVDSIKVSPKKKKKTSATRENNFEEFDYSGGF